MIPLRYAAFILAALTLGCLTVTPNSPATVILAGLFLTLFAVVAWTCRDTTKHEIRRHDA